MRIAIFRKKYTEFVSNNECVYDATYKFIMEMILELAQKERKQPLDIAVEMLTGRAMHDDERRKV